MSVQSLTTYMEYKHGVYKSFMLNRKLPVDVPPTTYSAYLLQPMDRLFCPVPGCTENLANESNLQKTYVMQQIPKVWYIHPRLGTHPNASIVGYR